MRLPSASEGDSPTGLQFGRGVRVVATEQVHTMGTLRQTAQPLDIAIEGAGFFGVRQLSGDIGYTRDGSFTLDANGNLVTSSGLLLDPPITLPDDTLLVTITQDGRVRVTQPGSTSQTEVGGIEKSIKTDGHAVHFSYMPDRKQCAIDKRFV